MRALMAGRANRCDRYCRISHDIGRLIFWKRTLVLFNPKYKYNQQDCTQLPRSLGQSHLKYVQIFIFPLFIFQWVPLYVGPWSTLPICSTPSKSPLCSSNENIINFREKWIQVQHQYCTLFLVFYGNITNSPSCHYADHSDISSYLQIIGTFGTVFPIHHKYISIRLKRNMNLIRPVDVFRTP